MKNDINEILNSVFDQKLAPYSGTLDIMELIRSDKTAAALSTSDVAFIEAALKAAASDIWQTVRVSERNLTGKDPCYPNDEPCKPDVPQLIHRKGIDESNRVHSQVTAALVILRAAIQQNMEI